ncbi:MAG: hypothetical protein ACKVZ0_00080 [Gemmatimonadales bacterium]
MPRRRKTVAERRQERDEAQRLAWEVFRPLLKRVQTYVEALALVHGGPGPDQPGRRYYSNLAFFLQTFAPPGDSSHDEKALYLELIGRFDAEGAIKPGLRVGLEEQMRAAMTSEGPFISPWR